MGCNESVACELRTDMKRLILVLLATLSLKAGVEDQKLSELELGSNGSDYLSSSSINQNQNIAHFLESENERIRSDFFSSIWKDILETTDTNRAIAYTDVFVSGLEDDYFGTWVLKRLTLPPFEEHFFSTESKRTIENYEATASHKSKHVRLLAIAGLETPEVDVDQAANKDELFSDASINALFQNSETDDNIYYSSTKWASLLVEAKKGNKEALDAVINDVSSMESNALLGLPTVVHDLGYLRQPEAIDLLVDFLFTDIPPENQRIRGDVFVTPLSHHAIKGLSQSLVDFPIDYWDPITATDLQVARDFIANYEGQWRIIGKWQPEEETDVEFIKGVEVVTQPEPATEEPAEVAAPEPSEEPAEKSSNWWLWLVGLAVVVGSVGLMLRRKS